MDWSIKKKRTEILGVNFGTSILNNSNWDKTIQGMIKKIQIWNNH